jgi:hypothetical protein
MRLGVSFLWRFAIYAPAFAFLFHSVANLLAETVFDIPFPARPWSALAAVLGAMPAALLSWRQAKKQQPPAVKQSPAPTEVPAAFDSQDAARSAIYSEAFAFAANAPFDLRRSALVEDGIEGRVICPCCGYPTLPEEAAYAICCLCFWECDGRSEADAFRTGIGPNGQYSLHAARRNFARYLIMFEPEDSRTEINTETAQAAKRRMIAAFLQLRRQPTAEARRQLVQDVLQEERMLNDELERLVAAESGN